uniref:D-lactate dehydrogenase (cytochrome) n=1 Tax=Mantoniella antarctica TaxID=81844 RepID=A0A7S0X8B5_9CHLO
MPEAMTSSLAKTFNDGLAHGGTVYPVPSTGVMTYSNVDGGRINDGRYTAFKAEVISSLIPQERVFDDPVKTFAYGTDASFYRLLPQMVVKVHTEKEVGTILPMAAKHQTPVTFRAAGTSLSGQAVTDSILLKLSHTGKNFRNYEIRNEGREITVEPGLILGEVNRLLVKYKETNNLDIQYKMGPDPSSIDSCMIGGVVANNSSGMCCGVKQNTYHTLKDMRIVFVDGTVLDTADQASRAAFLESHTDLVAGVVNLATRVQSDKQLSQLITKKHAIKCTTGYSMNALVDHPVEDPIEIIKRLMIGSEGTLGFVSQATYNTVVDHPFKASAFIVFKDVREACRAAAVLRRETKVDAVELFDRASLTQCEGHEKIIGLVPTISDAPKTGAALLIECRGATDEELEVGINAVTSALDGAGMDYLNDRAEVYPFTKDESVYKVYWDVRKGLIPLVGSSRAPGTSVLIEDVACEVDKLGDMTQDLIDMFQRFGYDDASCMGHALEGNLHLVFSQGFRTDAEVKRYAAMMQELCEIVAEKYQGSLKAEHGTGRNVAPFVEMEWGTKAYDIMWELKELFDPEYVLNPGVILNRDPAVHQKFLKPSPVADPIVDMCMECGFCESNCPSRDLTLTPRQRITVYREISRLQAISARNNEEQARLDEFLDVFTYEGNSTCAADGMCQVKCPVGINTGELIKSIRERELKTATTATKGANALAANFSVFAGAIPPLLNVVSLAHSVLGAGVLRTVSSALNSATNNLVPVWNPHMPTGAPRLPPAHVPSVQSGAVTARAVPRKVVYLPSCVTRMMGPAKGEEAIGGVPDAMMSIFKKADYEVIYPAGLSSQCCGMLFNSRGFKATASVKGGELEEALMIASEGGKLPIVVDTSPCLAQIKEQLQNPALRFALYEPTEFIANHLVDKLEWSQVRDHVAIHVPCSSKKMGVESTFAKIAGMCSKEVTPSGIPCCGMAGDRGMRFPELTGASLEYLELPKSCSDGYSSSRTCEMSLSNHSDVAFRGLVYLVDEATSAKKEKQASR